MTITPIQYNRRLEGEFVYERGTDDEQEEMVEIVEETIEHHNYDELCAKIRSRFKELLNLRHVPLFDLRCEYIEIPETLNGPHRDRFTNQLTRGIYDSIDWDMQWGRHARFTAIYYTLQDSNGDSSFDDVNTSNSSGSAEALGFALKRLDHVLNVLDFQRQSH